MKRFFIIGLILMLVCSGCAWFEGKAEGTADELINEGMEYFEDGKYRQAIESLEKLKDWYPFSKYAILAELKIGDARFHRAEYAEAIFAYEEFETLHPRNEAIPYVVYQIGRSYFEQVDTIDRDQISTQKALDTFIRLIKTYPDNEYAKKALTHKTECQKVLAGHDMYVGIYYYKSKHYKAALHRFNTVLTSYPDVGVHHRALYYITTTGASVKKMEEAEMTNLEEPTSWKFWKRYWR